MDDTISRQAVKYLDLFKKTYCRDESVKNDLVFRCNQCDFQLPDKTCLVKTMARKLCPDYKEFGSMGDLMGDSISRQAAINAVNDCGICIQKILDIPSVQTEQTTQTNTSNTLNALDCVSRQAAIDALWGIQRELQMIDASEGADITIHGVQLALHKIEQLPSAQPEPGWIPMSERTPEDGQLVLVQFIGFANVNNLDRFGVIKFSLAGLKSHIVAWMPIEPYERSEE